jgi:hypothetical protein
MTSRIVTPSSWLTATDALIHLARSSSAIPESGQVLQYVVAYGGYSNCHNRKKNRGNLYKYSLKSQLGEGQVFIILMDTTAHGGARPILPHQAKRGRHSIGPRCSVSLPREVWDELRRREALTGIYCTEQIRELVSRGLLTGWNAGRES